MLQSNGARVEWMVWKPNEAFLHELMGEKFNKVVIKIDWIVEILIGTGELVGEVAMKKTALEVWQPDEFL